MKLSIIVPAYNVETYLPATLDSLLSIRFSQDYEIIVVNDGSTDTTGDVVRDYQQKSNNIRLFTIENQGVSNARNLGLRQASGDYITFVDGDDTVEPDFYEKAVAELDSGGYDFVQGCYREVHPDKTLYPMRVDQDAELDDRREMLEAFCCPGKKRIHNNVWDKVFRADVARGVSFDRKLTVSEDEKYVFDILLASHRIKLLKDISVNYIQRSSSVIHNPRAETFSSRLAALDYMIEHNPYPELVHWTECQHILVLHGLCYQLCVEGNAKRAREIQKELLKSPYKLLWQKIDPQTRKRILLHKLAGPLYVRYLTHLR